MNAKPLKIAGAFLLENPSFEDSRGRFLTVWERGDHEAAPFSFSLFGAYHSYNLKRGILRGMHYQRAPQTQAKIVSCVRGSIFDVILDLRPESATHLQWDSAELAETSGVSLYIPHGCAHGFLTREDHTAVSYLIEGSYAPEAQSTIRWNDPAFAIGWPVDEITLSERDRHAPLFRG